MITPAHPRRAMTRLIPVFVLVSKESSTYPTGIGAPGAGRVKYRYASGFFSAAALLTTFLNILRIVGNLDYLKGLYGRRTELRR